MDWLNPALNGGSRFAEIGGIEEFDGREIMGPNSDNPDVSAEGPAGNRGGHNPTDNDFIFSIPSSDKGAVRKRKDLAPGDGVRAISSN